MLFSSSSLYLSYTTILFLSSSLYLSYVVFIIQLLLCKELFHQSSFYLNNVHFHHPASTLQRTISAIQVPLSQELFIISRFYLSKFFFIINITRTLCVMCFTSDKTNPHDDEIDPKRPSRRLT